MYYGNHIGHKFMFINTNKKIKHVTPTEQMGIMKVMPLIKSDDLFSVTYRRKKLLQGQYACYLQSMVFL